MKRLIPSSCCIRASKSPAFAGLQNLFQNCHFNAVLEDSVTGVLVENGYNDALECQARIWLLFRSVALHSRDDIFSRSDYGSVEFTLKKKSHRKALNFIRVRKCVTA